MSIGQAPANVKVFWGAIPQNYEGVPDTGTAIMLSKTLLERWLKIFTATEDLSTSLNCMSPNWKDDQPKDTPRTI
jgi:hypothetical protein